MAFKNSPSTPLTHAQASALAEALDDAFDKALDAGKRGLAQRANEASMWLTDMVRFTTEDSRIIMDNSTSVAVYDCYIDFDKVLEEA